MKENYISRLILIYLISLGVISSAMAQEESVGLDTIQLKKHEVKINALSTLLLQHPEFAYEYSINQDLSVGGRLGFALNNDYEVKSAFQMMPYVRWHFYTGSHKNAHSVRGFFAEVNTAYTLYQINEREYAVGSDNYRVLKSNKSVFGLGIGVGYKYISRLNWVVETSIIAGRNFSAPSSREAYVGFGLTIGKRF